MTKQYFVFLCALFAVSACTGSGGTSNSQQPTNPNGKKIGEGPCAEGLDCTLGLCVAIIDGNNPPNYRTQECGECPNGFWCDEDTFGAVGLSFCRFGDLQLGSPPRVVCKNDAGCTMRTVCATFEGERGCALPCTQESDCTRDLLGTTIDLETCAADQTPGEDRLVCLPDPECYLNPLNCISTGF